MNKRSGSKWLSLLLVAGSLAGCTTATAGPTGNPPDGSSATAQANGTGAVTVSNAAPVTSDMVTYDSDDEDRDWKNSNPTYIELQGDNVSISSSDAAMAGNKVVLLSSGVYVISGKLNDGQIIIDSQNKGTVRLVLNGADIHSASSAPMYVKNADKTVITLQAGTQNWVSDAKTYASTGEDDPNAAIFSEDDLTINGTGSLTVRGNYNNGIMSKDDLKITGGTIAIQAVDDGLVGRDMLVVRDGAIIVQAGGDGIKSTNDTDAAKGYVALEGGRFDIKSGADGIQAETSLLIAGGTYTITTNDGSANAAVKVSADPRARGQAPAAQTTATDAKSAKGIKAKADITISGGTFTVDSADDAIHSNNTVNIAGGTMTIASGDDGIHADTSIQITAGETRITKSYEGVESALITISGGTTHVVASDDGINVGGGADGSAVGGRPGQNTFSASGNRALHINGGYVVVDAMGDGLDANGSIFMTDGTVIVNGPTASMNGALDYDAGFEMTGGLLVAAGSAGMTQAPSTQSTQYAIGMSFSTVQQAGTLVSLTDSKGKPVVTFAPTKQFQTVVMASPQVSKGETYTLHSGGTATGTLTDGLSTSAGAQGAAKVVSFATANSVTWVNESGVTTAPAGGPGGMRPGGGKRP